MVGLQRPARAGVVERGRGRRSLAEVAALTGVTLVARHAGLVVLLDGPDFLYVILALAVAAAAIVVAVAIGAAQVIPVNMLAVPEDHLVFSPSG